MHVCWHEKSECRRSGRPGECFGCADVCTDAQSVEDNMKTAKSTRKIIKMHQVRPRTQYSPLRHQVETPSILDDGATSAMKGTTHTHRKPRLLNPYTRKVERSSLDDVSRCWTWKRGLRQVLRTKRLAIGMSNNGRGGQHNQRRLRRLKTT